jgi:hypothetical protein
MSKISTLVAGVGAGTIVLSAVVRTFGSTGYSPDGSCFDGAGAAAASLPMPDAVAVTAQMAALKLRRVRLFKASHSYALAIPTTTAVGRDPGRGNAPGRWMVWGARDAGDTDRAGGDVRCRGRRRAAAGVSAGNGTAPIAKAMLLRVRVQAGNGGS